MVVQEQFVAEGKWWQTQVLFYNSFKEEFYHVYTQDIDCCPQTLVVEC